MKPKNSNETDSLPATSTGGVPPGATRKGDKLILDWDGPDDPGNPRKCVAHLWDSDIFADIRYQLDTV